MPTIELKEMSAEFPSTFKKINSKAEENADIGVHGENIGTGEGGGGVEKI